MPDERQRGTRTAGEKDPDVNDKNTMDQGGFEDEGGTRATGGGLGQGGLTAEGVAGSRPTRSSEMGPRGRPVRDEAGYDELKDLKPGRKGGA